MKKYTFIYELKIFKKDQKEYQTLIDQFEVILKSNPNIYKWSFDGKNNAYDVLVMQTLKGDDLLSNPLPQATEFFNGLVTPKFIDDVQCAVHGIYQVQDECIEKLPLLQTKEFVKELDGNRKDVTIRLMDEAVNYLLTNEKQYYEIYREQVELYERLKNDPELFMTVLGKFHNNTPDCPSWVGFYMYYRGYTDSKIAKYGEDKANEEDFSGDDLPF